MSDEFVVTHHGDQRRRRIGQRERPVIKAGASTQPHPVPIDGQGRHQHHGRPGHRVGGQPRRRGFTQAERRVDELTLAIPSPLERKRSARGILAGHGQENDDIDADQRVDQPQRAWLGTDRNVGAYRLTRVDHRGQMCRQSIRLSTACLRSHGPSGSQDFGPNLCLCPLHRVALRSG